MPPELRLEMHGSEVHCLEDSVLPVWTVRIEDIVLIAEYTTNEGPMLDDWFVVVATLELGTIYVRKCPVWAEGDAFFEALSARLDSPMRLELASSTKWNSRVVWPTQLEGEPYFSFTPVTPATLWERITTRIFGPALEYRPTDNVLNYVPTRKGRERRTAIP